MYRLFLLFFLLLSTLFVSEAQDCGIRLSGHIYDQGTGIPLPFSNIILNHSEVGTASDSEGFFELEDICAGEVHLEISHVGCEPEHYFLELSKDTIIDFYLAHHDELLDEVLVHGEHGESSTQASSTISQQTISQEGNKNLADILESISGVSTIRNGSGISKPVIHGLSGNRVAILNNGIAQSGQQWGNDHAPEIDPFTADHLSVIKGAAALQYNNNSLGSVIMVEPDEITNDPHLRGKINYIFESNGLGHTLHSQLEKRGKWAAWKIMGTLKMKGDSKSPDYFLTNTGKREQNIAIQIEKDFNTKWKNQFYYSLFNTQIGVLRGSHIGNLTDLEFALNQDVPFYTEDRFSYKINAPKQNVNHHLIKWKFDYLMNESNSFHFTYGGQINSRKEFDVRRGDRTDKAALSLNQFSHFMELFHEKEFEGKTNLKSGIQFRFVDNDNIPNTGILPLIPWYESYTPSGFVVFQKEMNDFLVEAGGRYDFRYLNVNTISNTVPREILNKKHAFHQGALSGGVKYSPNNFLKFNLDMGYMLRSPEINELYSSGLHQGVSGIEEGQVDLNPEKSFKTVFNSDLYFSDKIFIQGLFYFQRINDFIFINPQDDFRLTIRGAFPLFIYEQTDANIFGTDLQIVYEPISSLKLTGKYSLTRGNDISNNEALINMPSDNISFSSRYSFSSKKKWKNHFMDIKIKYTARQKRIDEEQDYVLPPDAFTLVNMKAGTTLELDESRIDFIFTVENLLNTKYRDYLNRLRYFADEPGINFRLGINYVFTR